MLDFIFVFFFYTFAIFKQNDLPRGTMHSLGPADVCCAPSAGPLLLTSLPLINLEFRRASLQIRKARRALLPTVGVTLHLRWLVA
jgi:hypothetical protein